VIQYDTAGGKPVRVISVFGFTRTHSIVLFNLRTLHAHEVAFGESAADMGLAPMEEE
jgi:hypothetical protein